MRFLKQLIAVLSLTLAAGAGLGTAAASTANPQDGVDFKTLVKPQATDSGKKVEVLEFFGYFCPHCNALDPALSDWVKKMGDRIVFKRVHVLFHPSMAAFQQMYATLEAMGKVEEVHKKLFYAMHAQRLQFNTPEALTDFVVRQGIDKQKYMDVYNSFSVQSKVRRYASMMEAYGIDSVPQIFVDGRFQTSPDMQHASLGPSANEAALAVATTQVLEALVDRVAKERK